MDALSPEQAEDDNPCKSHTVRESLAKAVAWLMKVTLACVPILGRRAEREHRFVLSESRRWDPKYPAHLQGQRPCFHHRNVRCFLDIFLSVSTCYQVRNQRRKEWGETSSEHIHAI